MSQDADPKSLLDPDAALRRALDDAKAEPIPDKIVELAEKLEGALAAKRKQKPQGTG